MRLAAVPAATLVALLGVGAAAADPGLFVDHTEWVQWEPGPSLRVYPTPSARAAARQLGTADTEAGEAWTEVLARAPDANTPGMREQFFCHWQLAELAQPGKTSWNLEPWRPVVDADEMIRSGCNPGGWQEPF